MATPQEKIAVLIKLIHYQRALLSTGTDAGTSNTEREVFAELAAGLMSENAALKAEKASKV